MFSVVHVFSFSCYRGVELRLPRTEVQEVEQLREKWRELLELAEESRYNLLKDRRIAFEQELDKQVKVQILYSFNTVFMCVELL